MVKFFMEPALYGAVFAARVVFALQSSHFYDSYTHFGDLHLRF